MSSRAPRFAAAAAVGLGLFAVSWLAWLAPGVESPVPSETYLAEAEGDDGNAPPALARRLEGFRHALPGSVRTSENPGTAEDEHFLARAYPDNDIPVERTLAARAAAQAIAAAGIGSDTNAPGAWRSLGPTSAVYQATPYRSAYVPGQVSVSGRVTALAIASVCRPDTCRLYVAAAGGGLWRTDNALAGSPSWKFLTSSIGINAVGSVEIDPSDSSGRTLWIGTGEANASGDSAAGVGLYRSTDGGETWDGPFGHDEFNARAIGSIAIDPRNPSVIYAGTTRAVRGVASTGGGVSIAPGAARWGLWKSTDGGATFAFLHNGSANASECLGSIEEASNLTPCSPRGVRRVALDPSNPDIVYAGSYARGVWRSSDGGTTWVQIKQSLAPGNNAVRPEIAVTRLPNGRTRMYVGEGGVANLATYGRLFRTDDASGGSPVFTDLTSTSPANAGYGSFNYCTGQCWYDNLVVTPPGHPDVVYVGGSYQYSGNAFASSNGRALVLSTDGGASWTDMTKDATSRYFPNGLHPDHHALVVHPRNPFLFFSGSDGGVVRSTGVFSDESARCNDRGLAEPWLSRCRQLLSRVPARLQSLNDGLATLQFQSVSVDPNNPAILQGGTQDNGTFGTQGSEPIWRQSMWGDGGQSGFDLLRRTFRVHTYFDATPEVNFNNGRIGDWNWAADRTYFSDEARAFYVPLMTDPATSGWMWMGMEHVWRTKTNGVGNRSEAEFAAQCNSFNGRFEIYCGDWEPLGAAGYVPPVVWPTDDPSTPAATRLTASGALYGTSKAGGIVSRVSRTEADTSTLWVSTSTGRVFVSKNADAEPFDQVVFTRVDTGAQPNRFVSGISVDPENPNRAFVSFTGYSSATPSTPGHVFEVVFDDGTHTATWTTLDANLGDLPLNDVVYDRVTGDMYAANDFGVVRRPAGSTSWVVAGEGMPFVEVSSLALVSGGRQLYAATHGLSAWALTLR
ncbi:MAG: WD40/YVTN/BNR-like repeat-containing protein [Vicinamibacterales bacterium]